MTPTSTQELEQMTNIPKIRSSLVGKTLHSAGFSSENVFLTIGQDQVREVLCMTPQERLHMVHRFASWEALLRLEKLSLESSELEDCEKSRIEGIINECRAKLGEADQNMTEAKQYKALECDISAVLLEKDTNSFKKTLDQEKKNELKKIKEGAKDWLSRLEELKSQLREAVADVVKEEVRGNELQSEIEHTEVVLQKLADSLTASDQAVMDMNLTFANAVQSLHDLERKEEELGRRVEEQMNEKNVLMQHVTPGQILHEAQELNSWIEGEIENLESIVQDIQRKCEHLRLEIQIITAARERYVTQGQQVAVELYFLRQLDDSMQEEVPQLIRQSFAATNQYMLVRRQEEDCYLTLQKARNDLLGIQPAMMSAMGENEFHGWQGLKKLLDDWTDPAAEEYIGMLVDHLQVPEAFKLAVAAALGKKLFTHLTLTYSSASALLHKFGDLEVPGCLGFQVLNNITIQAQYPDPDGHGGVRRLLDVVQCTHSVLAPLLPHWLGNWLLCPDLNAAREASHMYGAHCITPEGDIVELRGTMKCGYCDPEKNAFAVHQKFCHLFDALQSAEASAKESSAAACRLSAECVEISGKMQMLKQRVAHNTEAIKRCEARQASICSSLSHIEDSIRANKQALQKYQEAAEHYWHQRETLLWRRSNNDYLRASFKQRLFQCTQNVRNLRKRLRSIRRLVLEALRSRNRAESTLKSSLLPERDRQIKEKQSLEDKKAALERELGLSKTRLAAICETRWALKNEIAEFENMVAQIRKLEHDVQEMPEETARSWDDLAAVSKQMEMLSVKEEGMLPVLDRERQCLQARLDRMNPPDLLAVRLFKEVSEKLDGACRHLQDVGQTRLSAGEMTDSQKEQQFEVTNFTLKQVSRYFEELFKKFVPEGCARMIFHKESQCSEGRTREASYEGIELKASFSSQGALQDIESVSGSQQTVVALCFILALQKCGPAPFCISGEVDACLDVQHRQCLADVLEELSSNSQFISSNINE